MAKIIKLDPTRKNPAKVSTERSSGCDHKNVIAYTVFRTVRCTTCGILLDPFDVLVDMLKSYVPDNANDLDVKRLDKEIKTRKSKKTEKDQPSPD